MIPSEMYTHPFIYVFKKEIEIILGSKNTKMCPAHQGVQDLWEKYNEILTW